MTWTKWRMGFMKMKVSVLPAVFLLTNMIAAAETPPAYPAWDGKESVAGYAKRTGLKPEETLDIGGVKLELALIPAGSFTMGSPETEPGRSPNEKQRKVTLTQPFYLGKYTVTEAQFQAAMGGPSGKADMPIHGKAFNEADACGKKMSELARREVKLPTEAQWEYACRAGSSTRFNTGDSDNDLDKAGWYVGNGGGAPHPVGLKTPNAWGLYDMHGNIRQFMRDFWSEDLVPSDVDPEGPASGELHSVRGGAYTSKPHVCRSAVRRPQEKLTLVGFRVLVTIKQ